MLRADIKDNYIRAAEALVQEEEGMLFDRKQKRDRSSFCPLYRDNLQTARRCNCTLFLLICSLQVATKLGISREVLTLNLDGCLYEKPAGS